MNFLKKIENIFEDSGEVIEYIETGNINGLDVKDFLSEFDWNPGARIRLETNYNGVKGIEYTGMAGSSLKPYFKKYFKSRKLTNIFNINKIEFLGGGDEHEYFIPFGKTTTVSKKTIANDKKTSFKDVVDDAVYNVDKWMIDYSEVENLDHLYGSIENFIDRYYEASEVEIPADINQSKLVDAIYNRLKENF